VDSQHTRTPSSQAKAIYRPRRAALNWVDYLVIGATVLTFLIVVATNNPHTARAQTRTSQTRSKLIPAAELPVQVSQLPIDAGLIKARIGLAAGGL
jgi:hypothetical protein